MRVEVGFGNKKFDEIHCSKFLSIPSTISHHSVVCLSGLEIGFVFLICKMKATITAVCQMNRNIEFRQSFLLERIQSGDIGSVRTSGWYGPSTRSRSSNRRRASSRSRPSRS